LQARTLNTILNVTQLQSVFDREKSTVKCGETRQVAFSTFGKDLQARIDRSMFGASMTISFPSEINDKEAT